MASSNENTVEDGVGITPRSVGGGAPSVAVASAPRLQISHILVWTACAAAYLACQRLLDFATHQPSRESDLPYVILEALIAGPAVGALIFLPVWRRAGYRFPGYAGECLMVVAGCWIVMTTFQSLVFKAMSEKEPNYAEMYQHITTSLLFLWGLNAGVMVIVAVTSWWAFACLKTQIAWRCFFFLLASFVTVPVVVVASELMGGPSWLGPSERLLSYAGICLPIALVVAIAQDALRSERLPWTHWLGVGVFVLQFGMVAFRVFSTYVSVETWPPAT